MAGPLLIDSERFEPKAMGLIGVGFHCMPHLLRSGVHPLGRPQCGIVVDADRSACPRTSAC